MKTVRLINQPPLLPDKVTVKSIKYDQKFQRHFISSIKDFSPKAKQDIVRPSRYLCIHTALDFILFLRSLRISFERCWNIRNSENGRWGGMQKNWVTFDPDNFLLHWNSRGQLEKGWSTCPVLDKGFNSPGPPTGMHIPSYDSVSLRPFFNLVSYKEQWSVISESQD